MNFNTWMPNYPQQSQFPPAWQMQHPEGTGYPTMSQNAPAAPQSQQQGFLTRPVASREEAVAAQIDFFGPGVLMPDFGHNSVYYKRFNTNTGACDFLTFRLETTQNEVTEPMQGTEYATKTDLKEIQETVQNIAQELENMKGGKRLADE